MPSRAKVLLLVLVIAPCVALAQGPFGFSTGDLNALIHGLNVGRGGSSASSTAFGVNALINNTGTDNTAIGYEALRSNTTGLQNTAVGVHALHENTIATDNTAIGHFSMSANVDGQFNTAVGLQSLMHDTDGSFNVSIGYQSMRNYTRGTDNTVIGAQALADGAMGWRNVAIGRNAGMRQAAPSDTFFLDNQDRGSADAELRGALLTGTFNVDPSLQTLDVNAQFTYNLRTADPLAPYEVGFNLPGFVLPKFGKHLFRLRANGQLLQDIVFSVDRIPPHEPAADHNQGPEQ